MPAARLAGIEGVLITFLGGLLLVAWLPDFSRQHRWESLTQLALFLPLLAAGITLLAVTGPVRKGSKPWTIVSLLIAISLAALCGWGTVNNFMTMVRYGVNAGMLWPFGVLALLATLATLLAYFSLRSLRFPDRLASRRGFEPLMPKAIEHLPDT